MAIPNLDVQGSSEASGGTSTTGESRLTIINTPTTGGSLSFAQIAALGGVVLLGLFMMRRGKRK